jgi:hypothetical protein
LRWQGTLTECLLPFCCPQVRQLEWDTMGAAGAGKLGKHGAAADGELQPLSGQFVFVAASFKVAQRCCPALHNTFFATSSLQRALAKVAERPG